MPWLPVSLSVTSRFAVARNTFAFAISSALVVWQPTGAWGQGVYFDITEVLPAL
jgi:hypothetical protein